MAPVIFRDVEVLKLTSPALHTPAGVPQSLHFTSILWKKKITAHFFKGVIGCSGNLFLPCGLSDMTIDTRGRLNLFILRLTLWYLYLLWRCCKSFSGKLIMRDTVLLYDFVLMYIVVYFIRCTKSQRVINKMYYIEITIFMSWYTFIYTGTDCF